MALGDMIGLGALGALIILPIIIWIVIAVWMAKDAKKRGESPGIWFIVGCICGIIGLIIWLVKRPPVPSGGYQGGGQYP